MPMIPFHILYHDYRDESGCDCRRVILRVHRRDTCELVWEAAQAAGAFLDPLNPQTYYSETLLDLFRRQLMTDRRYIQRLKRHYKMFKNKLPQEPGEREAERSH